MPPCRSVSVRVGPCRTVANSVGREGHQSAAQTVTTEGDESTIVRPQPPPTMTAERERLLWPSGPAGGAIVPVLSGHAMILTV